MLTFREAQPKKANNTMKPLLICALIIFAPVSMRAADRLSVEASFFSAAPGTKIPNDLRKLDRTKGISRKTDRAITESGRAANVQATRTFVVGPGSGQATDVPTGVIVRVTPRVKGDQVTYTAQLTVREFRGFNNPRKLSRGKLPPSLVLRRLLPPARFTCRARPALAMLPGSLSQHSAANGMLRFASSSTAKTPDPD